MPAGATHRPLVQICERHWVFPVHDDPLLLPASQMLATQLVEMHWLFTEQMLPLGRGPVHRPPEQLPELH